MGKFLVFFCAVLLFAAVLLTAGCNAPPNDGIQKKEFSLYFAFEKGSVILNTVNVSVEGGSGAKASREMKTITLVKDAGEAVSELQILMIEARALDGNRENLCLSIPYIDKKTTVKFHKDGNVEYGANSAVSFHLPAQKVAIGGTWEFEGIEYTLAEETKFSSGAGDFNCLKITIDGVQSDAFGTKRVSGYFLFDPEKHLKLKEELLEEWLGAKTEYKSEITGIISAFDGEIDYSCLYPPEKTSALEKYFVADNAFGENQYEGALELLLAIKQQLAMKSDLSAEEILVKKASLALLADTYGFLGNKEKEIGQRIETAEFFEQFLSGEIISAADIERALSDYRFVSQSGSGQAKDAAEKLEGLNSKIIGNFYGKAILSDTGDSTGVKILAAGGGKSIEFRNSNLRPDYSVPLYGFKEGSLFGAIYYMKGYGPKALAGLKADKNTLSEEHRVILQRMDGNTLGYLAGLCYSLDGATGEIRQFDDLNFSITKDLNTFTAECKNGFYSIPLEPGIYMISLQEKAYEITAGETTIAHYGQ